ncbi:insulin receptor substrate 1-B isoform X2 [Thalassophryne amazonica]|uniref:insulin receptor substrate 1-B isoform X2 n=1 Tax=Thalassophryne amazonica TaxID=390379 RepID=UPI0014721B2F|nr:insulin receptor substrate 1-B isoform X2 [Thalassophryne amazonica]XP_034020895.1 insulin receptor substrate 1-B isoform X2 [Thalassophryne amazonica]
MESQVGEQHGVEDVRKSGYLRKQKSMHRRYFVLRAASERGPARLEYYESEKKFRGKAPVPKRAVLLETCFNINKRADSKNKHMIVLYTRAESFAVAADNEADQDEWYQAMVELQCKSKNLTDSGAAGDYGVPNPGPAFKEVWQVKVWPKGLGQAKNLVGIYRLCLTEKTVNFVKLNSDAAAVVLQLMNVRRCGHSENFFFVEVGRSAVTGQGEFWMQVDDSVVAQNMHETLLEAMKALSEEFRQRSKSQSNSGPGGGATASNPISVPSRRHHPNPPPSQVGFIRRPRTEPPLGANSGAGVTSASASPTPRHSFPRSCTASDGGKAEEGVTGSTPLPGPTSSPSTNGSCSTTPILRSMSARSTPATAAKTPLGLMRSISTPAPSPAPTLSSGAVHGSDFGGLVSSAVAGPGSGPYSRVPMHHTSISCSPSDYGSSDEYGSSPGDHALLSPASLPGSSVGSASSQFIGEEVANYIVMGQRDSGSSGNSNQDGLASSSLPASGSPACNSQPQTRRVLRRSSSRECEAERQLLSKRASLPPMALERLAPRQHKGEDMTDEESADYAIMSRSVSRESFTSSSSSTQKDSSVGVGSAGGGGGYLDVAGEFRGEGSESGGPGGGGDLGVDNGYMSMLPGVTRPPVTLSQSLSVSVPESDSKAADDYMAMTPNNSVSPPQQIKVPPTSDGYMIMSPNSSCSPDQCGSLSGGAWVGSSSADSRAGSDYMNMSPISARSVNGSPPPADHTTQLDASSQLQAPKMVYSYYSLPRSYKHSPSTGQFDEGPGRGRRPIRSGSMGMSGSRARGGHQERLSAGTSVVGRHLSLSSSSYSSSSASSESLGENDERPAKALSAMLGEAKFKDKGKLQQKSSSGGLSMHSSLSKSRPVSLYVDVSKANTLPRVRENPLPAEPKSPGEYVSIEFKGEECSKAGGGGSRGRGFRNGLSLSHDSNKQISEHMQSSCVGSFIPLPQSPCPPITPPVASEYVNMDLGPSQSPSPLSVPPIVFPSFHTPPTPPTLSHAPKACDMEPTCPCEEEAVTAETPLRTGRETVLLNSESESPTSSGDYTVMAYSLNSKTAPKTSISISPTATSPTRTDTSVPVHSLGLDFPLPKPSSNPDLGAKVIRADPQGRRRHCSETFLASPSLTNCNSSSSSSTTSLFPEHSQTVARRLGFESMLWGNGSVTDTPPQFFLPGQQPLATNTQNSSTEQGLNYIDLDLANKERPHLGLDGASGSQAPSLLFSALAGSSAVGGVGAAVGSSTSLNTYASIDFYKSEELRTHQNGNEGTEC